MSTEKAVEEDKMPSDAVCGPVLTRDQLIRDQQADAQISTLAQEALTEEEAQGNTVCYFKKSGVLMRKWRPLNAPATDEWKVTYQIVVPRNCQKEILELAYSTNGRSPRG